MFTQSLTKGSDDAQKSLQKLTRFIENEHEISPYLEKKVLGKHLNRLCVQKKRLQIKFNLDNY